MSYKNKHLNKLKHLVLGTVLAATTLGCSGDNQPKDKVVENDMLAIDKSSGSDLSGRTVVLAKAEIPIYRTAKLIDEKYQKLTWCPKLTIPLPSRKDEKTHAEKIVFELGEEYYVEAYRDGVLKAQPSMAVIDGRLVIIGDDASYETNLIRHQQKLQQEAERKRQEIEADRQTAKALHRQQELARQEMCDSVKADTTHLKYSSIEPDSILQVADSLKIIKNNAGRE